MSLVCPVQHEASPTLSRYDPPVRGGHIGPRRMRVMVFAMSFQSPFSFVILRRWLWGPAFQPIS